MRRPPPPPLNTVMISMNALGLRYGLPAAKRGDLNLILSELERFYCEHEQAVCWRFSDVLALEAGGRRS